jgi:hypothetical protein
MAKVSSFDWTLGGAQNLTLEELIQNIVPMHFQRRYPSQSIDGTVVEVVTVGSMLYQIACSIRVDTQGAEIDEMISAGLNGIPITLTYNDDSPGTFSEACQLIEASPIGLEFDGRLQLYHAQRLVWRRLDGGNFNAIL